MDNFQSVLMYLGGCSVFYLISKSLDLIYRSYPENRRDCPPASYCWLFSGVFRILSFPLSYIYRYLDRMCEKLSHEEGVHESTSFWLKEINELNNQKWSRNGSREIKSLLFAQTVWFEISGLCQAHHFSGSLDFKVNLYACFQHLLKDTLYQCASGNVLNNNFKALIYHYTNITANDIAAIDRLVHIHNNLYDILHESSPHPSAQAYESTLSAAILWGVPDNEYDDSIYDLSKSEIIDDFANRVDKLKAYAIALFTNDILE